MLESPTVASMSNPTTYLTVSEVVDRLAERGVKVTDQTVRRWIKRGKVQSKRLGVSGRFLVEPESLDRLFTEVAA